MYMQAAKALMRLSGYACLSESSLATLDDTWYHISLAAAQTLNLTLRGSELIKTNIITCRTVTNIDNAIKELS